MNRCIAFVLLLVLCGCAGHRTTPAAKEHIPPHIRELFEQSWLMQPQPIGFVHSVDVAFPSRQLHMMGYMRLDSSKRSIRLAAMNDFGVKFFSIHATAQESDVRYALPRTGRIIEGALRTLRTVYLSAYPRSGDLLCGPAQPLCVSRSMPDGELRFLFDDKGLLREVIRVAGPGAARATYGDYREHAGRLLPHHIEYTEHSGAVTVSIQVVEIR